MTSILISHKLKELFKVADSITVLRDGKTVRNYHINEEEVSENKVIKEMVGRDLSNMYSQRKGKINDNITFEAKNWSAYHTQDTNRKILHTINVTAKQEEIVGLDGQMG